ncbi:histone-like nucleoid-structuring protein Lsr2 [Streptomyces sp. NPDC051162]|uniref:Lsr2 family DNA-binding protein n=1 Tax=Streptomyces sp. NPDC051162 TaxID=3154747 RepID=UPI003442B4AD
MNLLGRLLTDGSLPLHSRVASVIVLLYAQTCTRVVRLTVDDVVHDNDQVRLRLGEPPSPVPHRSHSEKPTIAEVRAWARDNGHAIPNRGRLRADIWTAWHAVHPT